MDSHIKELFEEAPFFTEGELALDPEYNKDFSYNMLLEDLMEKLFGPAAHTLLMEFLDSYYEIERFNCLHYFYQGYLAAKAEEKAP